MLSGPLRLDNWSCLDIFKTSQICQYRVCPPVASMHATQGRRILLMSPAICSRGILLHSSCKASPKAWSVLGRGTLCRTRWPRMSQICSIGDKSGDRAGQSRWSTLFCCRNCCTILARWGLALLSCSTTWCCWTKGRTTGCSTSLM